MRVDPSHVRSQAVNELRDELHREAVEREKVRLRTTMNTSLWQRLIDKLPFTITLKRKPQ